MLTGVTVAEYIRKRRLTLAAKELTEQHTKVIHVALKYGYESPESFSKAFRKAHGVSPSEVKNSNKMMKAFPRLSFQIQLKGEKEMNYKITEKEAFEVHGKGVRVSTTKGENNKAIAEYWEESHQNGFVEELNVHATELGILGVCLDFDSTQEKLTYFIGVEGESEDQPNHYEKIQIPASTWAIFESIGPMPHAIQEVWNRIFSEWFPSTGYEHAGTPELEVYPDGDANHEDYRCEVWIPIIKN